MTNFEYMLMLKTMRDRCDSELARMNKEILEDVKNGKSAPEALGRPYIPSPEQVIMGGA